MALEIRESIECFIPTCVGEPHVQGFLYWQPAGKKAWKRHYAVAAASFILLFPEKEAENPIKPIGAICYEDLEVMPLEPPPAEQEVADVAAFSFSVSPIDSDTKGKGFFSKTVSRHARFCRP